jgi:hypothetical protein
LNLSRVCVPKVVRIPIDYMKLKSETNKCSWKEAT